MGRVCRLGLGLAAHSLWRNAHAGRAAIRRRDWRTAHGCLATIRAIEAAAGTPSLRASAAGIAANLGRAVSDPDRTQALEPKP
ncbi:hypothetical protein [Shumkonia mesophila]|uniref:hypothetical protein n=1 Tax=Shumkonia mesophila TaxID=2838854 RepID=UPI0029344328|nr:hypothetical protein [Shumkonia mesophila]